jgi:response regulator RpfG family c-di-GMP phosphodiesterase
VEFTEYAAFLHDIGRVSLNEPSVLRMGFSENDLARWGAEIVGETEYLSPVADVVARQYQPFRSPGDSGDPDLPVPAKIVKIASAYDESRSELGFSPLEAMERLHRGAAYDYDPEIVAVLRTILDRRGEFHPVAHPA